MTSSPAIDPGPPPAPPASAPPARPRGSTGDRFFAWSAGLGLVRGDGWIGGVAAGIAARLRIDPLIVRGILVVVGLFGFPVLFLYAVAWAVLPDLDERIPLRGALHGRFSPALVGIAAFALLGLVPAPLALLVGAPQLFFWHDRWAALFAAAAFALGLVIVAGFVVLIVRAAVRSARAPGPVAPVSDALAAAAASDAPGPSAAASGSGPDVAPADAWGVDAAGFAASTPSPSYVGDPGDGDVAGPGPEVDPVDEYAAWRAQHAAWKVQDDAWRHQQRDVARAARDQARRERHAHAAAFSAAAAESRRIRRLTKPRTPFAYVATVLGIALVAGAIIAVTDAGADAGALALFVAALVVALGMVAAGAFRRRSGFLACTALLLLAAGTATVALPTLSSLHVLGGDYGISNLGDEPFSTADAPFVQPWGIVSVYLSDPGRPTAPIYIDKDDGGTQIKMEPDVALNLDITVPPQTLIIGDPDDPVDPRDLPGARITDRPDGRMRIQARIAGPTATAEQTLVLDQRAGWVDIDVPFRPTDATTDETGGTE